MKIRIFLSRVITLILIIIIIFLNFISYAEDLHLNDEHTDNLFLYEFIDEGKSIAITKYIGPMDENIIFPAKIKGLPVKQIGIGHSVFNLSVFEADHIKIQSKDIIIGDNAFKYLISKVGSNSKIIFLENIESIGKEAFAHLFRFDTIILPEDMSLTKISENAFFNIDISYLEIPIGMNSPFNILDKAKIEYLYLKESPDSSIIKSDFKSYHLMHIYLEEDISQLEDSAFENFRCASITLPYSLKYIGKNTFNNMIVKNVYFNCLELSIYGDDDPILMKNALNFTPHNKDGIRYVFLLDNNFSQYLPETHHPNQTLIKTYKPILWKMEKENKYITNILEIQEEDEYFFLEFNIDTDENSNIKIEAGSKIQMDNYLTNMDFRDDRLTINFLEDIFYDLNEDFIINYSNDHIIEMEILKDLNNLNLKIPFIMGTKYIPSDNKPINKNCNMNFIIDLYLNNIHIDSLNKRLVSEDFSFIYDKEYIKDNAKIYYHFLNKDSDLNHIKSNNPLISLNKTIYTDNRYWNLYEMLNEENLIRNSLVIVNGNDENFEKLDHLNLSMDKNLDSILIGNHNSLHIYRCLDENLSFEEKSKELSNYNMKYLKGDELGYLENLSSFIEDIKFKNTHIYLFYEDKIINRPDKNSNNNISGGFIRDKKYIEEDSPMVEDISIEKEIDLNKTETNNHLKRIAKDKPYVFGYKDGSFRPKNPITREEISYMIYNLFFHDELYEDMDNNFIDLDADHWSTKAINILYKEGIVSGYKDGSFRNTQYITRAEALSILFNLNEDSVEHNETPFIDIEDHWAKSIICEFKYKGYIDGYGDNTFRPDNFITRAEIIKIINLFIGRKNDYEDNNPFKDIDETDWFYQDILKAAN